MPSHSWTVFLGGKDLSASLNPYLLSIEVTDEEGLSSDTAHLCLDDTGGRIALPAPGKALTIAFDAIEVFSGIIDEVRSAGDKNQGRLLSVSAKGFDAHSHVKTSLHLHKDNASFQEFMQEVAQKAGIKEILIDPEFQSLKRPYWSCESETFLHFGERMGKEMGGIFKIQGDRAVFAKKGSGKTPLGRALPQIVGVFGKNLISWDIEPLQQRFAFSQTNVRFFNREKGQWHNEQHSTALPDHKKGPTHALRYPKATEMQAKNLAQAQQQASDEESGGGTVSLLLTPEAKAGGFFTLAGARDGIDGVYKIASAAHRLDKTGGGQTNLSLKKDTIP